MQQLCTLKKKRRSVFVEMQTDKMENLYGLSISVWNASKSTDRLTAHPDAELGFGSSRIFGK
ncbi:hypothetical protein Tsp_01426 [Trichinella spiralis]|uniref:hypothetical protein n=1 Tax=Trichinella spiralis TaxID=6334 RepID=UPI0001EFB4DD|nr:hypothetical protein Tsp_01426 [Trichinella spiralis]